MHVHQLIFAAAGALLMLLAVPLIRRRVPPNEVYGLRVPATFEDEQVWYDANAASGRELFGFGALLVLLAFVPPALGLGSPALEITWVATTLVGVLALAAVGWRRANRMLRERQRGAKP